MEQSLINKNVDFSALQFAIDSGMLDISTILEQVEMQKRKDILNEHPYSIYQGSDGFWRTYLPTADGRKLVKKKNKIHLEDVVIKHYEASRVKYTFEDRFNAWMDRQKLCGITDNSIQKYNCDYNRFFKGYPICEKEIKSITEEVLVKHFRTVLSDKKIPYRALKGVFGNVNGVFEKAVRDKIISINICRYIDLPLLQKYCTEKKRQTAAQRTLSDAEVDKLINKIHNPINKNPNPVANMAVELAVHTGMRVGELAGLMWKDINDECIRICHSEKHNKITNEYYIDDTKNHKIRFFPLTDEIKNIFERVRAYEQAHGYLTEFVFSDAEGRLHVGKISSSAYNKCGKSIHAIRRTLNSRLKCNGVSTTVASALLGHTERVNEENYTYDVLDIAKKRTLVEECAPSSKVFK